MFVTKEELELVDKWNQSVSRTDSEPRFIELDDFLLKQTVPNSKLLFIHIAVVTAGIVVAVAIIEKVIEKPDSK